LSLGPLASTNRTRRRGPRPLVTAVTILIILGVAATGYVTIRELQVQRSVYAKILQQKLEATRTQFRVFLAPFGNHLTTAQTWHDEGLLIIKLRVGLEKLTYCWWIQRVSATYRL
jgi:hypothetical protein